MKKNFYLQHPLMAMNDPRMQHMVDEEGLQANGAYWFILEKLALIPESRAQLIYLKPFCKACHVSYKYIKKIVLNYQLFIFEEDGYFSPAELNPPVKSSRKAEEMTAEKANFERKTDEIEQKYAPKRRKNVQKQSENAQNASETNSDKCLLCSDLPNIESDNTIDNNIYIITTAATTEEKEETAAAAISLNSKNSGRERKQNQLCLSPVNNRASPMTQLTVRNDAGHQPKPRSPALTSCVIGGAELCHWGCRAVSSG